MGDRVGTASPASAFSAGRIAEVRTGQAAATTALTGGRVSDDMRLLSRLAQRRSGSGEGRYVCTLCGARYDHPAEVICPKCREFVVEREQ